MQTYCYSSGDVTTLWLFVLVWRADALQLLRCWVSYDLAIDIVDGRDPLTGIRACGSLGRTSGIASGYTGLGCYRYLQVCTLRHLVYLMDSSALIAVGYGLTSGTGCVGMVPAYRSANSLVRRVLKSPTSPFFRYNSSSSLGRSTASEFVHH